MAEYDKYLSNRFGVSSLKRFAVPKPKPPPPKPTPEPKPEPKPEEKPTEAPASQPAQPVKTVTPPPPVVKSKRRGFNDDYLYK